MQEQSRRVWVFFEDDYHLCRILKYEKCAYDVELPDGNILNTTNVQRANPPKFDLVDDLASLSHLNEPAVLYVLKNRYHQNMIYTHSGLFLVAVNPYKNLDIYSSNFIKMYSQNDTSLPPHIYKTVNEAYTNMILNKNNQSILITGESGAGKTENTKKAISFLLTLSENDKVNDKNNSNLVEQIIKANVILESFGNAMTIRNDNSSRFGKFIQLNFKSGNIVGCTIEKYLLEKSRVVKSNGNERNYHIFYQLLRSNRKDLLEKLGLSSDIKKYKILNNFTDLNDTLMFDLLIDAFDTLNFEKEEIFEFFKFVAVILHLGNIEFYEEENVKIKNMDTLNLVCNLLNIPISKFVKYILHPNKSAGKEKITVIHSINQCKIILEGVIKILYDYLFDKIIESINKKLNSNTSHDNYIGILDIAGFEIFPFNSLEQLSINYTNEKLQQFFNHHMFILEQEIYKREEIDWNYIDFGLDLKPTIDTIEKVFNILEDQCSLINSNDKSFLISLQNDFNNLNDKLSFNKIKDSCFNLIHYAGKVEYDTNDWLVKNYDPYFTDIINLLSLHKTDNLTSKGFFRTVSQLYKNQLELLMNKLRKTNPFFVRCIIPNNNKKRGVIDSMLVLKQLKCNGILEGIRISRLGYPNRMNYEEFVKRYKIIIFNEEKNINFNKEKRINEENNGKNNLSYFNKNINNTFENNSLIYAVKITKEILNRLNISKEFYKLGKSMIFFKQDILAYIEESRENKVSLVFNKVIQYVNSITHTLKQNKICSRMKSIKILQHNALLSNAFRRWQWWYFYLKIKPLLKVYQMDDIIKGKEKEISYLTDSLKEKENYLKLLQNENNEIKNKLISKEKMNESINLLIYEKENELEKLKNSLKKIKEEENEKNNQINLLLEKEEELEKLKNTFKKVKEEEKEKNEILEEKENLLNEHKRKIIELQTELETNENLSKNKTEEIIKIKDKEITKMKYEIELLKEKEEKLIEEKKEKENLKNELKSVKNENKLLKNDLNKVNQKEKELTNNLQEESFKLMDLESKFGLLKMDNELLIKEIEKNNSKINELEEKMSNYELLEEENFNLKENIHLQKKTIDSLKERNLGLEEKIKKIESSNISELNIKINELNKKLSKEKRNLKHLEKENSFLAQENKRLNSDKIKELEEIKEGYEKKIKELDLKLLSYNFNLKEESESTEDNRVILLLEEEKLRSNELERLLTEQENKNVELQSKLKNKEYELIDKINNLERKYNLNKERFNLLITGLTEYYSKITLNNQPCNCYKKFNLIINKQEKEKEYLNNQLTNLKNELKTNQEDLLINFKELNNLEIKLKEKEIILKLKEKELKNLNLKLEKELKEKNDLICKFNDYVDCSDKLNELEVVNLQLKRQVDELSKVVEFYKPFSGLKK